MRVKVLLIILVSLVSLTALLAIPVIWWETPDLHVDVQGTTAVAHMELMGDYPSNIRSIELSDADQDRPIWKTVAAGDFFQIHSLPLTVGDNSTAVKLYWGQARDTLPAAGSSFRLAAGTTYRIRICPDAFMGLCRSRPFTLGG